MSPNFHHFQWTEVIHSKEEHYEGLNAGLSLSHSQPITTFALCCGPSHSEPLHNNTSKSHSKELLFILRNVDLNLQTGVCAEVWKQWTQLILKALVILA